jgi:hypothetical protein
VVTQGRRGGELRPCAHHMQQHAAALLFYAALLLILLILSPSLDDRVHPNGSLFIYWMRPRRSFLFIVIVRQLDEADDSGGEVGHVFHPLYGPVCAFLLLYRNVHEVWD